METLVANLAGKTRRERWLGRDYLVAPLTLIVPGVLPGSKGPLYYPPDEVAREPDSWNHVPIVVYHPTSNGSPTTARRPDVLERQGVGYVFNAGYRGKLRGEGWFDIERTKVVDPRVLTALEAGNPFELSTGLYTDNEPAPGGSVFNSASGPRPYTYIARNYRPDHLAVLPDRKGACSVADGCGVLVNEAGAYALDLDLGPVLVSESVDNAFDPSQARDSAGRWTHEAVAREVLSAVHEHLADKRLAIRLHDLRQTVHARLPGTTKDQVTEVLADLHKSHHIVLDKDSRPPAMIPPALKDAALTEKHLGYESTYAGGGGYYTSARPGRNASLPLPTFPTAQAAPASVPAPVAKVAAPVSVPAPVAKVAATAKVPLDVHMQKTRELVDNPPSPDVARAHVDKLSKDLNKDEVLRVARWVNLGAANKKDALKKIHDRILRINSSENHRDQSTYDTPEVFTGFDLLTANKFNSDQPRDSKGRWMPAGMAKGTGRTPSAAGQSAMAYAALGKKADVSSHVNAIHTLRSRGTDLSKEEITAHVNRLGRHLNKAQVHDVARGVGVAVAKTKKDTLAAIHEHLSSQTAASTQASSQTPAAAAPVPPTAGTLSPTVPNSHAELAQATAGKQGFTGPFQRGPYTVVRHDDSGHIIEAEAGSHSGRFAVKDPSNVVHSRHDTAEAAVAAIPSVNRIGTSQGTVDKQLRDRAAQAGKSAAVGGSIKSATLLDDYRLQNGLKLASEHKHILRQLAEGEKTALQLHKSLPGLASARAVFTTTSMPAHELVHEGLVERGKDIGGHIQGIGAGYAGPGSASATKVEKGDPIRETYRLTEKGRKVLGLPPAASAEKSVQGPTAQEVRTGNINHFRMQLGRAQAALAEAQSNKKPGLAAKARKDVKFWTDRLRSQGVHNEHTEA